LVARKAPKAEFEAWTNEPAQEVAVLTTSMLIERTLDKLISRQVHYADFGKMPGL
jgi:hypothetical protein